MQGGLIERRRRSGGKAALVPRDSIAGRSLVTVVAIMTFLATLTAGAAFLVSRASDGWRSQVAQEMTIQVRPSSGRDLEADTRKAAEIASANIGSGTVRVFTKAESSRLLEPWLGTGLNLDELPVPRMIILKPDAHQPPNIANITAALSAQVPVASLDDHRVWLQRLASMASTMEIGAAFIFLLVLVATSLAVSFATNGAMAGNREIIDVLHFVGARDAFVAREFQGHFLRLGASGAAIGAVAAIALYALAGIVERWWTATPGGDQVQALFGSFAIGWQGYAALAFTAIAISLLTGLISRIIVMRHLRSLY
ncbi:MAG: ABC transporter permease [Hyphomicrobiales bacterium]|nr:ABC transporter permease [Hyphomicrobiales bacterium]MDE2113468.1 ABC transporter permease [Hyphomicrobiales bacterium]